MARLNRTQTKRQDTSILQFDDVGRLNAPAESMIGVKALFDEPYPDHALRSNPLPKPEDSCEQLNERAVDEFLTTVGSTPPAHCLIAI